MTKIWPREAAESNYPTYVIWLAEHWGDYTPFIELRITLPTALTYLSFKDFAISFLVFEISIFKINAPYLSLWVKTSTNYLFGIFTFFSL